MITCWRTSWEYHMCTWMRTTFSKRWSESVNFITVMDIMWKQMLAVHRLISSCFSWNHGRRGCLGPGEEKSRMEMKWSVIETDEVKWRHAGGCCMLIDFRQHAAEMKKTNILWRDIKKKNNNKLNGDYMTDGREHFHLSTASWQTREHAGNEKRLHRYKRKTICYQSHQYIFTVKDNTWS